MAEMSNTERQAAAGRYHYRIEPTEPVQLKAGDRVKLDTDRYWWTVRAVATDAAARAEQDPVVVLTRQAEFHPRDTLVYTVIDWRAGVRGPVNIIGQGWEVETDKQCQELADKVQRGEWQVTPRNWRCIEVSEVRHG